MKKIVGFIMFMTFLMVCFAPFVVLPASGAESLPAQEPSLNSAIETIINKGVQILFAGLGILITVYLAPWLKDKKLYGIVTNAVQAAEKLAEKNKIDKKQYVLDVLASKGITVNIYVEAIIEACVLELDKALGKIKTDAAKGAAE